jgi:hypothetical protein
MMTWHHLRVLGLVAATAATGPSCDSPADPFTTGPGHASVAGKVTDASGAAVTGTTVSITCAGMSAVTAPTDSLGAYGMNLSLSAAAFDATGGRPSCRFTEPAVGTPQVQLDTALGFARGPVLVPLQMVNLQRP